MLAHSVERPIKLPQEGESLFFLKFYCRPPKPFLPLKDMRMQLVDKYSITVNGCPSLRQCHSLLRPCWTGTDSTSRCNPNALGGGKIKFQPYHL